MSPTTALHSLKYLFQDRPEVLRMLDLREFDLAGLESEALIKALKERQFFPEPVNFYATGRTGAGKTSLGNSLVDSKETLMESHGYQDCTNSVQFFILKSNLRYFDLPGAGSNEEYENINRAALGMAQISDDDEDIAPVNQFDILRYSEGTNKPQKQEMKVEDWKSIHNQQQYSPDVILYVVAPHMQFIRDDKRYLKALLKSLKKHSDRNKVIFALNIHYTKEGTKKPTSQNIEDVRRIITEIYQQFYSDETPLIAEIESLKGTGISQVAEFICNILPENKIGHMQEALRSEFKDFGKKERSHRYRDTIIKIAARLATYTVDTQFGNGIVEEAYAAVCDYGLKIFREEDMYLQFSQEIYEVIGNYADQTKKLREEIIKTTVNDVEEKEVTESQIVGYTPEFEEVEVPVQATAKGENTGSRRMAIGGAIGAGFGMLSSFLIGVSVPVLAPVLMASCGGLGAFLGQKQRAELQEKATRMEKRFVRAVEERKDITKKIPTVVQTEKEVGTRYLQGGFPVVKNLLSIGLAVESISASQDLLANFEVVLNSKQEQVQEMLGSYEEEINQLAESSTTPEKTKQAEEQIIEILQKAVIG